MMEVYAAGAIAAFTVDVLVYPLDTIKTRYQSQDYIKTYASSSAKKGPVLRGLYQGIGSVVLATLPAGLFHVASTTDLITDEFRSWTVLLDL
ncbi:hypothetical protein NM208_g10060 [Fusarium decemcellulare]|uniref:Uncharacterized protein n=1 Tax=Fusarium decemcellulare TaxID=57161 RepID=A0ACC1RZ81_9HYPO|nr:hypothetical protein NM208_g10060 [Fusarium decemcellulare]